MTRVIDASGITGFAIPRGVLAASVAGNALTISIKTAAGGDPSPTDLLFSAFRTLSGAGFDSFGINGPLNLTISAGSKLGGRSGFPFRIWILLFNDGGTFRLGAINCTNSYLIFPLTENGLASAVAEGGAGAADLPGVIYASQAITSKFYRIVGYMDWPLGFAGTAGNWSTLPAPPQLFGPGVLTPGAIVQENSESIAQLYTTLNLIPLDNTIPQLGEGYNISVRPLTPTSACNVIEVEASVNVSHSVASPIICSVFRDTQPNAISAAWSSVPVANGVAQVYMKNRFTADDALYREYNFNVGASNAGTLTISGVGGAGRLGTSLQSLARVAEIMG